MPFQRQRSLLRHSRAFHDEQKLPHPAVLLPVASRVTGTPFDLCVVLADSAQRVIGVTVVRFMIVVVHEYVAVLLVWLDPLHGRLQVTDLHVETYTGKLISNVLLFIGIIGCFTFA